MHLFIFSSENIKKYRSLPIVQKISHVGVLVFFMLLFALGHWMANYLQALEYRDGPFAHLAAAREALSKDTQIIFLGSSHVIAGIRPELFSVEAMNVAGAGYNYDMLAKILRKHLDSMPNLKLAVIELDPVPLMLDPSEIRQGDYRSFYVWGLDRADIESESETLGERVLVFMSDKLVPKYRLTPKTVLFFIRHRSSLSVEERQVIAGHRAWGENGVVQAGNQVQKQIVWLAGRFSEANLERNLSGLRQMIYLLLEYNVQIVFLQLPHHTSYSTKIPFRWRQAVQETEAELQKMFKRRIPFWDYEQSKAFDETHFKDYVHLNSSGASKLCGILNERISTFMTLHPRGGINSSQTDKAEKSE